MVLISRNERNLFQYKFEVQGFQGVMAHKQVEAYKKSIELLTQRRAPTPMLHAWNAEGWYVVGESKILMFTTENKIRPPRVVVDMFNEIEKQPIVVTRTVIGRDICFGFCYGPLAALGFDYLNSFNRYSFLTP